MTPTPHRRKWLRRTRWLILTSAVALALLTPPSNLLRAASWGVVCLCVLVVVVSFLKSRSGPRPGPPTHPVPVTGPIETSRGSQIPKEKRWTQSGRS
jgi:hypothetical protein